MRWLLQATEKQAIPYKGHSGTRADGRRGVTPGPAARALAEGGPYRMVPGHGGRPQIVFAARRSSHPLRGQIALAAKGETKKKKKKKKRPGPARRHPTRPAIEHEALPLEAAADAAGRARAAMTP